MNWPSKIWCTTVDGCIRLPDVSTGCIKLTECDGIESIAAGAAVSFDGAVLLDGSDVLAAVPGRTLTVAKPGRGLLISTAACTGRPLWDAKSAYAGRAVTKPVGTPGCGSVTCAIGQLSAVRGISGDAVAIGSMFRRLCTASRCRCEP